MMTTASTGCSEKNQKTYGAFKQQEPLKSKYLYQSLLHSIIIPQ